MAFYYLERNKILEHRLDRQFVERGIGACFRSPGLLNDKMSADTLVAEIRSAAIDVERATDSIFMSSVFIV